MRLKGRRWVELVHQPFRGERGQALIFFAGGLTIIMGIAVVAVDAGLWYSDRGVARKDADAAAAGAGAVYDPLISSSIATAEDTAKDWAEHNGADRSRVEVTPKDCLAGPNDTYPNDALEVTVGLDTQVFFGVLFDVVAPEVKAAATACVASAETLVALRPLAVALDYDDVAQAGSDGCLSGGVPRFGVECVLYLRHPTSGDGWQRIIDLDAPGQSTCSGPAVGSGGLGDIEDNVEDGASEPCSVDIDLVYQEVNNATTGRVNGAIDRVRDGLEELLDRDDCDGSIPNGQDDFSEVVTNADGTLAVPGDGIFVRRNCDGDRLVYLPAVSSLPGSFIGAPIDGFIPFFVTGCIHNGTLIADCNVQGSVGPGDSFGVVGIPIKLQQPVDGPVKPFDPYGTRRIFLSE